MSYERSSPRTADPGTPGPLGPGFRVFAGLYEIEAWKERWSAAVESCPESTLYWTHEWVSSLAESRNGREGLELVVHRGAAGGPDTLGVLFPLVRERRRKLGWKFGEAGLLTNYYATHNDLIDFTAEGDGLDLLLRHLDEARAPWDVLFLSSIHEGGRLDRGLHERFGDRIVGEDYIVSPFLDLPPSWDDFLKSRSANFRSDLKRKQKRLEAAARTTTRVFRRPDEVDAALGAIYEVERHSWKEEAGTSITANEIQVKFYGSFVPKAAAAGWLYIPVLYLGETPIAYDLGVIHKRRYYMLKTSYVADQGDLSPGFCLRTFVVRSLIELGVHEHDFLGKDEPWKVRWASGVRRHRHVYLFNTRRLPSLAYLWAKRAAAVRRRRQEQAAAAGEGA